MEHSLSPSLVMKRSSHHGILFLCEMLYLYTLLGAVALWGYFGPLSPFRAGTNIIGVQSPSVVSATVLKPIPCRVTDTSNANGSLLRRQSFNLFH